jgi:hypothetical protein
LFRPCGGSSPAHIAWGSSFPDLTTLPRHGDAGGIADLDPNATWAGLAGAVAPLRHDALGAKPTRMGEDGRTILGDVFAEQDARLDATQEARQRRVAVKEGALAQILAVVLDQVEGIEDCGPRRLSMGQLLES